MRQPAGDSLRTSHTGLAGGSQIAISCTDTAAANALVPMPISHILLSGQACVGCKSPRVATLKESERGCLEREREQTPCIGHLHRIVCFLLPDSVGVGRTKDSVASVSAKAPRVRPQNVGDPISSERKWDDVRPRLGRQLLSSLLRKPN